MSDVQELLARAAELAAGMTREEALEGLAEVCGVPRMIPVDVSVPVVVGDPPAGAALANCPACGAKVPAGVAQSHWSYAPGRGWLACPANDMTVTKTVRDQVLSILSQIPPLPKLSAGAGDRTQSDPGDDVKPDHVVTGPRI